MYWNGQREQGLHGVEHAKARAEDGYEADVGGRNGFGSVGVFQWSDILHTFQGYASAINVSSGTWVSHSAVC